MLVDINPGAAAGTPVSLIPAGSKLVFFANDGVTGTEPWVSDGTAGGTSLLMDIWPGASGGFNPGCVECNAVSGGPGVVFFSASDGSGGSKLWKTDGTPAGTVNVYAAGTAFGLTRSGNYVYFASNDALLHKSDGTAAGTTTVSPSILPTGSNMTDVNGDLYFPGTDGFSGVELYRTDGTAGGTSKVIDLSTGNDQTYFANLTNIRGTLYFLASGSTQHGLFMTNGPGTTVFLKNIDMQGGPTIDPRQIVDLNGTTLFIGSDATNGVELWKTDGTPAGTVLVKDIYPGDGGGLVGSYLVVMGNLVYFKAADDTHGYELWKSDGTAAGTVMVKDINVGLSGSSPVELANIDGTLFFRATVNFSDQPWTSDGTTAGTTKLATIYSGNNSAAASFTRAGGTIFFAANDGSHGLELWSLASPLVGVGGGAPPMDGRVALARNAPNPVTARTQIEYSLATEQRAVLRLFDAQGRLVRTLLDGFEPAGTHRVSVDAAGLSGGVYFYQLEAGGISRQRKMVVLGR
ncbi:MAG: ELWxxDGT repeat protein [Candidatus Eisenbacteria bacterium]